MRRYVLDGILASMLLLGSLLASPAASGESTTATSPDPSPSGGAPTLMSGWEQHFALQWTAEPATGETRTLRGYITSMHGESAERVRVLAQALDASGAVVGQRIEWVPGGVGGFGHVYFEVPHLPSAAAYRVSMWAYDFIQAGDQH